MTTPQKLSTERLEEIRLHAERSPELRLLRHIAALDLEIAGLQGWKEIDRNDHPQSYEKMKHSQGFMENLCDLQREDLVQLRAELARLRGALEYVKFRIGCNAKGEVEYGGFHTPRDEFASIESDVTEALTDSGREDLDAILGAIDALEYIREEFLSTAHGSNVASVALAKLKERFG